MHLYVINGPPVAWARPGRSGSRYYDTQKSIKNHWCISLESQRQGQPFYKNTPLLLEATFYFGIPGNLRPKKKEALYGTPYIFKPDIDNLEKFILDTCNSFLYDDDCRVYSVIKHKFYELRDKGPSTEFSFTPYPGRL